VPSWRNAVHFVPCCEGFLSGALKERKKSPGKRADFAKRTRAAEFLISGVIAEVDFGVVRRLANYFLCWTADSFSLATLPIALSACARRAVMVYALPLGSV